MKTTGRLIIFIFTLCALIASAYAADDSPLFEAVRKGDKAAVEVLLAKGADVNAKDQFGDTPLHAVLMKDDWDDTHKDIVTLLLAKGADVNSKDRNNKTPLHWAACGGTKVIVVLLLGNGANLNATNDAGTTPLHEAARCGKKDIVELFLTKRADINAKDMYGDTPLNTSTKEAARLVAGQQKYKNDAFMFESLAPSIRNQKDVAELLENHILKQANPQAVFAQLTGQLKGNPDDISTRRLIIKLANELKPAPTIPEEARKHFVEGTAIVKTAKNPAQQTMAAQSFIEALKIAPWWGDAYYNLGVAQELSEKYDEAEQAFNFYLLSNPSAVEKREVQDRIYGISAKRKLAGMK